jgi:alpha-amylase
MDCSQNMIEGELSGLPDLDLDNLDVIDYHINTIISWIKETGIDAIRMDTAKHVERGFWNYFKTNIRGKYPEVSLIGEVLVFSIDELTEYQKFWGFDCLFDFPVQETIQKVFAQGQSLTLIHSPFNMGYGILEKDNSYSNHNRLVSLLDNHDLSARFMTVAMNNAGNNKENAARIFKLALGFIFTTRGIPQLYYGTEIGIEGGSDPDNRRDFEWNKFDKNYDVKPEFAIEKNIFEFTKSLIKIRRGNDALVCGTYVCLYVDYFVIAYLNYFENNIIITVINNGWDAMHEAMKININSNHHLPSRIKAKLNSKKLSCQVTGNTYSIYNGEIEIKLDGKSMAILK